MSAGRQLLVAYPSDRRCPGPRNDHKQRKQTPHASQQWSHRHKGEDSGLSLDEVGSVAEIIDACVEVFSPYLKVRQAPESRIVKLNNCPARQIVSSITVSVTLLPISFATKTAKELRLFPVRYDVRRTLRSGYI
jgi:hypothetical protein